MQTNEDVKVADRIRVKMAEKNLKQIQIAEAIGSSKGTVSKWLSGKNVPKNDYLIRLARLLGTTPEWIIGGGEHKQPIDGNHGMSKDDRKYLIRKLGLDHSIDYDPYLLIEMNGGDIDYAAQALEAELDSQIEGLVLASQTGIISYTNNSNAMNPKLYNNAECMIDTDKKEVRDGKMYLYRHGMIVDARYLHKRADGGFLVRCENKTYKDEVISANQLDDFEVIGWIYKWTNEEIW